MELDRIQFLLLILVLLQPDSLLYVPAILKSGAAFDI